MKLKALAAERNDFPKEQFRRIHRQNQSRGGKSRGGETRRQRCHRGGFRHGWGDQPAAHTTRKNEYSGLKMLQNNRRNITINGFL